MTATMTADVDDLSATFAALADPTRRAILGQLAKGDATVNELAEPFTISLQAVSKHLKVLENAGLISRGRDAQFRPCRLEQAPLRTATDWIETQRELWEGRFDRLDEHLRDLQRNPQQPKPRQPKPRQPKTRQPKTRQEENMS